MKTLRFLSLLTFLTVASFAAPTINSVVNNYSYTPPSSSNYGIAPGSIFVIFGTQLSNSSTGLQELPLGTNLQGVTVTASVAGVTKQAILYYVTPTQVAGILPSAIPVGTGTIAVNNNGQVSAAASLKVLPSDFGILTLTGSGAGAAAVYDAGFKFLSTTNSAKPTDVIQIFGTGVGPTTNDETIQQVQTNLTNIPMTAEIGGVQAEILYRGRTIYPGLDQINIKIPTLSSAAYGCNVSLIIKSGSVSSNGTTIPVAEAGGTCPVPPVTGGNSDPNPTQSEISAWAAAGTYTVGGVSLLSTTGYSVRDVAGSTVTNVTKFNGFSGNFNRLSGSGVANSLNTPPLINPKAGTCVVITTIPIPPYALTPLNAGPSITVAGPNGTQTAALFQPGIYNATVPNTYMVPGRYTFAGQGGTNVGSFAGTLDVSPELVWTNADAAKVVTRPEGVTVQWTGGDTTQLVTITGQSALSAGNFGSFFCWANNSAGQFTVSPSVLSQLPASPVSGTSVSRGSLTIYSYFATRLTAPGVDLFTASGEWSVTVTSQYK